MAKTREELEEVFNLFDTNGNGYLEPEEIVQAAEQLGQQCSTADLNKVFQHLFAFNFNRFSTI